MRAIVAAALLILVPRPSLAYYTAAEVTSIQGIYTAMIKVEDAWVNLGTLLESVNTADADDTDAIWLNLALVEYRMARGVAYLYDVNPTTQGAACGANRAACVASANTEITLAITALNAAKTPATDCKTNGSQAFFRTACAVIENDIAEAITGLGTTYNSALTYASPHNPWYPLVIGPHGDFEEATFELVAAIDQGRQALEQMRQAWDWQANGESAWNGAQANAWDRLVLRLGNVIGRMHIALMTYNLIPHPQGPGTLGSPQFQLRSSLSPFMLIANMYEFLLSNHSGSQSRTHCCEGLPYHYDNFGFDSYVTLTEAMVTRPTARAIFTPGWRLLTVVTWFHSDGSAWFTFEFPDDATLAALRVQKNQLNDPHGPPVTYIQE